MMRTALTVTALVLAGCATVPEERDARCEAAVAVLATYKAARAAGGGLPAGGERAAAAAAETLLLMRCAPPAPTGKG